MSYKRFKVVLALGYVEADLYRGIVDFAIEKKWRLDNSCFHTGIIPNTEGSNGIISMHGCKEAVIDLLKKTTLPIVDTGVDLGLGVQRVNPDNWAIGQQVGEHFIRRGFENFAFVKNTNTPGFHDLRLKGFADTIAQANGNFALINNSTDASWEENFLNLLKSSPFPLAVMTASDTTSSAIVKLALEQGIRIPQDLALMGVKSDDDLHRLADIPLSHIESNNYEIGRRAATVLHEMMLGSKIEKREHLVKPGKIIVRQSSDILAIRHPEIRKAVEFIDKNYHKHINVSDVLAEIDLSAAQAHLLFRRFCHSSILQELTRQRLEKAQSLLINTDLKIKEIANLCGFSTSLRMTIIFKRELKLRPSDLRRKQS